MTVQPSCLLITGGNRGIGLEITKQLIKKWPNCQKYVTTRNIENSKQLMELASSHANLHVKKLDVSKIEDIQLLYSEIEKELGQDKGIDLLINNSAIFHKVDSKSSEIACIEGETFETMMESYKVNSVAPLILVKQFLPLLIRSKVELPLIVNISSTMGSIAENSSGGAYNYRMSKAALNMLTKNLSIDLQPYNIHCISMHPGWVKTVMGGSNALITTEQSVNGLLDVISEYSKDKNGSFIRFDKLSVKW